MTEVNWKHKAMLSSLVSDIVPSKYEAEDYALGITRRGNDSARLEINGIDGPADNNRAMYVSQDDLAQTLAKSFGWTIIREPLPEVGEPDEDGDFYLDVRHVDSDYVGFGVGDTPESVRKAGMTLLAIADRMEKDAAEAESRRPVHRMAALVRQASIDSNDPAEIAKRLLEAGVQPPKVGE